MSEALKQQGEFDSSEFDSSGEEYKEEALPTPRQLSAPDWEDVKSWQALRMAKHLWDVFQMRVDPPKKYPSVNEARTDYMRKLWKLYHDEGFDIRGDVPGWMKSIPKKDPPPESLPAEFVGKVNRDNFTPGSKPGTEKRVDITIQQLPNEPKTHSIICNGIENLYTKGIKVRMCYADYEILNNAVQGIPEPYEDPEYGTRFRWTPAHRIPFIFHGEVDVPIGAPLDRSIKQRAVD